MIREISSHCDRIPLTILRQIQMNTLNNSLKYHFRQNIRLLKYWGTMSKIVYQESANHTNSNHIDQSKKMPWYFYMYEQPIPFVRLNDYYLGQDIHFSLISVLTYLSTWICSEMAVELSVPRSQINGDCFDYFVSRFLDRERWK